MTGVEVKMKTTWTSYESPTDGSNFTIQKLQFTGYR